MSRDIRGRPATIREVSQLANVSRITVTRVLREPHLVREATRRRVEDAISRLRYVPNRAAGSLSSRRSGFVGLIVPTLTNVNYSTVAHGMSEVLRRDGYNLLIGYDDYSLAAEEVQIRTLIARRPEAIVLTGASHTPESTATLLDSGITVIEIADNLERPIGHAVGFSNVEAGRLAARYLLGLGFKRLAAAGSQPTDDIADHRGEARIRGFEQEVRRHAGATVSVIRCGSAPVSYDHGAQAIKAMTASKERPEAIFFVSDLPAVGAILECQRRGIDVPSQLSIIGFGDFDIGREMNPALTTIRIDFFDLGRRAGELILDQLSGDSPNPHVCEDIELALIERASVSQYRR